MGFAFGANGMFSLTWSGLQVSKYYDFLVNILLFYIQTIARDLEDKRGFRVSVWV